MRVWGFAGSATAFRPLSATATHVLLCTMTISACLCHLVESCMHCNFLESCACSDAALSCAPTSCKAQHLHCTSTAVVCRKSCEICCSRDLSYDIAHFLVQDIVDVEVIAHRLRLKARINTNSPRNLKCSHCVLAKTLITHVRFTLHADYTHTIQSLLEKQQGSILRRQVSICIWVWTEAHSAPITSYTLEEGIPQTRSICSLCQLPARPNITIVDAILRTRFRVHRPFTAVAANKHATLPLCLCLKAGPATHPSATHPSAEAKDISEPSIPEHARWIGGGHGRPEERHLVRKDALRIPIDGAQARVECCSFVTRGRDICPLRPERRAILSQKEDWIFA